MWLPLLPANVMRVIKPEKPQAIDFSVYTKDSVSEFSIAKEGEEDKVFKKEDSGWKINGYKASNEEVFKFLENVSSLKVGNVVSKNSENFSNFGLDNASAYKVTFNLNGAENTFLIGNFGSIANTFYMRKKDANEIYEATGSIRALMSQSLSFWREKLIFNVAKTEIYTLELKSPSLNLSAEKLDENKWKVDQIWRNKEIENSQMEDVLNIFANFEATDFLADQEKQEFESDWNKYTVFVKNNGGEVVFNMSMVEKKEASEWWVMVEGREDYYKVASYKVSDLIDLADKVFAN